MVHDTHFPGGRFGNDAGLTFVFLAVFLGHAEGRAMTATKISAYLDKPRTTVLRRLEKLTANGVVARDKAGRYTLTKDRAGGPTQTASKMTRAIKTAAVKLSKMDTQILPTLSK